MVCMLCANVSLSERRGQACLGYAERKKRRRSQRYIKAPHGVFCLFLEMLVCFELHVFCESAYSFLFVSGAMNVSC